MSYQLALPAPRNLNRLVVRRRGGLFELRSFVNGKELECVHARDAQSIIDHVKATWPMGTKVQWIVLPNRKAVPAVPTPARTNLLAIAA